MRELVYELRIPDPWRVWNCALRSGPWSRLRGCVLSAGSTSSTRRVPFRSFLDILGVNRYYFHWWCMSRLLFGRGRWAGHTHRMGVRMAAPQGGVLRLVETDKSARLRGHTKLCPTGHQALPFLVITCFFRDGGSSRPRGSHEPRHLPKYMMCVVDLFSRHTT